MTRVLVLSAFTALFALATPAQAQPTSIKVEGQLAGGNFVTASCTISNTGQITGTGVLYGQNPANGYMYKYPFVVTKGTTAQGKLILSGYVVGGPNFSLSSTVPAGAMVFSYVVNGNTYSLPGQGTVSVK